MSDGLPSEEQLRRIERGVQRRIDLRRRLARRVAGGCVAVLVVVGGFTLLRPLATSFGGASSMSAGAGAAGSAGRSSTAAALAVRCHGAVSSTVAVDPARLPAAALVACAAAQRTAAARAGGDAASAAATASPQPSGAVLCRAADGALSVWPGPVTVCAAEGLRPYPG